MLEIIYKHFKRFFKTDTKCCPHHSRSNIKAATTFHITMAQICYSKGCPTYNE